MIAQCTTDCEYNSKENLNFHYKIIVMNYIMFIKKKNERF